MPKATALKSVTIKTMATPVIELKNVSKRYGSARGIDEVSFKVEPGQVFGFLGPNGAGKSTTINMLVDLIRPSEGKISIFGLDSVIDSLEIRRKIGFLTGDMSLDESLTGLQQLTYFGNLRGDLPLKRIHQLAELLQINLARKIKTLSRGNRQKVGLISALMHDPELLILDEPTSGLDPIVQSQFNKIILDHKKSGKTTFMSSHVLSEVQEICDQLAFIRDGKILNIQSMSDIGADSPKIVNIVGADSKLITKIKALKGAVTDKSNGVKLDLTFAGNINDLLATLAKHDLKDINIQDADLEAVFMKYYQEDKDV